MSRAKFEVDGDLCIGCGLCEERAPENMQVPATLMHARVARQPTTDEEEEACIEATEYCPTMGLRRVFNEETAAAGRPDERLAHGAVESVSGVDRSSGCCLS